MRALLLILALPALATAATVDQTYGGDATRLRAALAALGETVPADCTAPDEFGQQQPTLCYSQALHDVALSARDSNGIPADPGDNATVLSSTTVEALITAAYGADGDATRKALTWAARVKQFLSDGTWPPGTSMAQQAAVRACLQSRLDLHGVAAKGSRPVYSAADRAALKSWQRNVKVAKSMGEPVPEPPAVTNINTITYSDVVVAARQWFGAGTVPADPAIKLLVQQRAYATGCVAVLAQ